VEQSIKQTSRCLAGICLLVASVAFGQQSIKSEGDHNQVVGTNTGLIVQENIQVSAPVQQVLRSTAKINGLKEQGWLSVLTPGNTSTPPNSCSSLASLLSSKASKAPLLVELGSSNTVCTAKKCNILSVIGTDSKLSLLSVERSANALFVNAQIYDEHGEILAVIDHSRPHINKSKLFGWSRPNAHQLSLIDQHNETVLRIDFVNNTTLSVAGTFYGKNKSGVRVTNGKIIFLNSTEQSSSSYEGICSVLGDGATAFVFHDPPSQREKASPVAPALSVQNGIGITGGTVIAPSVTNLYGIPRPLPQIASTVGELIHPKASDSLQFFLPKQHGAMPLVLHPIRAVEVTANDNFNDPAIFITCDRPCALAPEPMGIPIEVKGGGNVSWSPQYYDRDGVDGFGFRMNGFTLRAKQTLSFAVQSVDLSDFKILAIQPFAP
jgi:hypothetical protein